MPFFIASRIDTSPVDGTYSIDALDRNVGIAILVGSVAAIIVGHYVRGEAFLEGTTADTATRRHLATRLAVCVSGYAVVPSETPPPAAATAAGSADPVKER